MSDLFRCSVVVLAVAFSGCGGNTSSNGASGGAASAGVCTGAAAGAELGNGGIASGGAVVGDGGSGGIASGGTVMGSGGSGARASCTVGADHTCNDDPRVSSIWGRCEGARCLCKLGFEVNPDTGKCRIADAGCYSPTQNLDSAYSDGAFGCMCDVGTSGDTCRADSSGRLVALTCFEQRWQAVEDGACAVRDATISLRRGACFGGCPVYSVTITPDGRVNYDGEAYVGVLGAASRLIDPNDVHALADEMERLDYFNLNIPEECPSGVAHDGPIMTTSLTRYGRTHRIARGVGDNCAPSVLSSIEKSIDEVAGTAEWVACPQDGICTEP